MKRVLILLFITIITLIDIGAGGFLIGIAIVFGGLWQLNRWMGPTVDQIVFDDIMWKQRRDASSTRDDTKKRRREDDDMRWATGLDYLDSDAGPEYEELMDSRDE